MKGQVQILGNKFLVILGSLLLSACMLIQQPKASRLPFPKVTVSGNVIYSGGKPFAEVKYFELFDSNKFPDMPSEKARGRGLGLVMHYFQDDREVWLRPENGFTIRKAGIDYTRLDDMKRIWQEFELDNRSGRKSGQRPYIFARGRMWDKDAAITSVVYDVRISDDGRYVHYRSQGVLLDTAHAYRVEDGR